MRSLLATFAVLVAALGATGLPVPPAPRDLALTRELTSGTQPLLRVIVRTRPEPRALDRVTRRLTSLMAATGVAGAPQVHDQLFAVTAQVTRDSIAALEADADVLRISTDAPVRSLALGPTDAAWTSLVAQRNALRQELDRSVQAVRADYAPRIDDLTATAVARRARTEALSATRTREANDRLTERQAEADQRVSAAAARRAERESTAQTRQTTATTRKAQRDAAAAQRNLDASATRVRRESAANARSAVATNGRKLEEAVASTRVKTAADVRTVSVSAASARKSAASKLAEPMKSQEIAAADAQITAAYAAENAEKQAAATQVTTAKTFETQELTAASSEISAAKSHESVEKTAADQELSAAKADYEAETKAVSVEFGAAKTEYEAALAWATAERKAALAEHPPALEVAAALLTQAATDYTADMTVVAGVVSQRDQLVKNVEQSAAPAVAAAQTALAANNTTFVAEVLASAKKLDELASRAATRSLRDLIANSSKSLTQLLPKIGSQREDHLLQSLGLERSYLTGYDVGVAVVDSGINTSGNGLSVVARYDFTGTETLEGSKDAFGHGTHVASLIAGTGVATAGVDRGIAPNVRLIDLKVLDKNGMGYTSDVILAVDYAIANRTTLGIDVINLSLGHPIYEPAATDPLVQAIERAVRTGIVVVASAGNVGRNLETGEVGYAGVTSPGNAPSAITVGSLNTKGTETRSDDEVAAYSSRGPTWYDGYAKPDLVAPGHRLVGEFSKGSTLYETLPGSLLVERPLRHNGNTGGPSDKANMMMLSGTSMATGVTSGVVALMIEANRHAAVDAGTTGRLSPNAIKAMLQFTAYVLPDTDVLTQGAGAINPLGATALAANVNPAVGAGQPWLLSGMNPVTETDTETFAWGQHIVWGDQILWGDSVYFNQPAWAQHIVWGNQLLWGDHIVWGNHIVWGDMQTAVWGNHIVWGNQILWGDHIVWGDLSKALGISGTSLVWGNTVTEPGSRERR